MMTGYLWREEFYSMLLFNIIEKIQNVSKPESLQTQWKGFDWNYWLYPDSRASKFSSPDMSEIFESQKVNSPSVSRTSSFC